MALADDLLLAMWQAVSGTPVQPSRVQFVGDGTVRSAFAATDFAAASVATAGLAISQLLQLGGAKPLPIRIDRELASAWFSTSYRPLGWEPPHVWHPVARYYEAADGWILIHANNAHHRQAALRALGCAEEREAVAQAVSHWAADDVEQAILAEGGCVAAMHSIEEWDRHPEGIALAAEPLVDSVFTSAGSGGGWEPKPERPLEGVKVLDLTRILAGPVATRFLAGFGANVLRIDPPDWNEPLIPEVSLGKRCARLDLKQQTGLDQFRELLAEADVLVHGYRPGALEGLGLGPLEREAIRPGLIDVSLDAYGWTGPWAGRRGFDSLVQVSTGIADRGRIWAGSEGPTPLPFQALDHATGYLLAAAAIQGLLVRAQEGRGSRVRCSLARTARLFVDDAHISCNKESLDLTGVPLSEEIEMTSWGPAKRVQVPLHIPETPVHWTSPAMALGTSPARW